MVIGLSVGDRVVLDVGDESREWGFNPGPNGKPATVVGFGEFDQGRPHRRPGIYVNDSWATVRFDDGVETHLSSTHLKYADEAVAAARLAELRALQAAHPEEWYDMERDSKFLRELPETPFWEGDEVRVVGGRWPWPKQYGETTRVLHIDYDKLDAKRDDGSPYPAYHVKVPGGHTFEEERHLELVSRGNVWKYYHGEALTFEALREEGDFFYRVGKAHGVRNQKSKLYDWSIEEAVAAIRDGLAHGIRHWSAMGPLPASLEVVRYDDEVLGEKIRAATLEGFKDMGASSGTVDGWG